jgi:hypothetical protein
MFRSQCGNRRAPPRVVRVGGAGVLLFAAIGASACGARYVRSAALPSQPLPQTSVSRNILLVSVDGLRPDAIATYGAPTLQRLMRQGSYTLSATTIDPSTTLPSHISMLTGLPPERHGVLWNNVATAQADSIELPNVFSVARAHGYSTAAFFSKAKFQPLQRLDTLDYSQAPGGWFGLIHRMVGNLIDNAIRHAPPGSSVRVDLDRSASGYVIAVRDLGPGVSDDVRPYIFERFYRGDAARQRGPISHDGAGLGLALARWIARSHGGDVDLVRSSESGSTFVIALPSDSEP